ncbi:hypothetical protein ACO0SA_003178 [Hanseniaspora valbyensis]
MSESSSNASTMDAATKRKMLLREKRKQQMKSKGAGSDRLQKIVGGANSLMTSESVLDKPKTVETPLPSSSTNDTSNMLQQLAKQQDGEGEMPNMFDFMKGMGGAGGEEGGMPDMAQLMQQFTQNAGGTPGQDQAGAFGVAPEIQQYHSAKLKQFKYRLLFFKWFFLLLPYLYLLTHPSNEILGGFLNDKRNFLMIFSTIEVLSVSLNFAYAKGLEQKTKYKELPGGKWVSYLAYIPQGIVPFDLVKIVGTAMTWLGVVNGALVDFSFIVLVLVLVSYYHV